METKYDELLKALKEARETEEKAKGNLDKLVSALKATEEYSLSQSVLTVAQSAIAEIESKIRGLALTDYAEHGEKKVHESVTVKIFKTFKVVDKSKVREWVLKNMPIAMQPDMKKVEEFAKEGNAVDGTEVGEEARAQIATKL